MRAAKVARFAPPLNVQANRVMRKYGVTLFKPTPTAEPLTNLVVQSENFIATYWTTVNTAITSSNNSDARGGNTAGLITATAIAGGHAFYNTSGGANCTVGEYYTFSVKVKPGTVSRVQLTGPSGPFGVSQYANFSLSGAGSVLASAGVYAASIAVNANGYYLCSITVIATSTATGTSGIINFINSDTATRGPSFTAAGTESLYICDWQYNLGTVIQPYQKTPQSITIPSGTCFQLTDLTTPAVQNSVVGRINCSNGSGIYATQGTTGFKPTLKRNANYWLDFDNVDDVLNMTAIAGASAATIIKSIRGSGVTTQTGVNCTAGLAINTDNLAAMAIFKSAPAANDLAIVQKYLAKLAVA